MAFTYDPDTLPGTVRLLISDVVEADAMFTDAEIERFLTLQSSNVYLAAAMAYGTILRSRALLAKRISREGYSSEEFAIADLKALIDALKEDAVSSGGLQWGEFALKDEDFESYRPEWVGDTQ